MVEIVVLSAATSSMQVATDYPGDWTDIGSQVNRSSATICRGVISDARAAALRLDTDYQIMREGSDWSDLRSGNGRHIAVAGNTPGGTGLATAPLSLTDAASQAQNGDTFWIVGDTSADLLTSVAFAADDITIRNVPGKIVTVDASIKLSGDRATVRGYDYGLVFICSDTRRVTDIAGSNPPDWPRALGSLELAGDGLKIINVRIDNGNCLFDFGAHNSTIYGVISTFVGWIGPDRTHGHAWYTHNNTDANHSKTARHCVFANSIDNAVGLFSASTNDIRNYSMTQCVVLGRNLVVGTDEGNVENVVIDDCALIRARLRAGVYWQQRSGTSIAVRNNRLWWNGFDIEPFASIEWRNNRIHYGSCAMSAPIGNYDMDANAYSSIIYFEKDGDAVDWQAWRNIGIDAHSDFTDMIPDTEVVLWTNEYEPKFAICMIYNWNQQATVQVPCTANAAIMHNVLDWDDTLEIDAIYGELTVPMTGWINPAPSGLSEQLHTDTFPRFGCFLIEFTQALGTIDEHLARR